MRAFFSCTGKRDNVEISPGFKESISEFENVWPPLLADLLALASVLRVFCFLIFEFVMFKGDGKEQTQLMNEHHEP